MIFEIKIPGVTEHNFNIEDFNKELNSFLKEKLRY